ncbi:nodulin homeobox isoform X1 [Typha latifolia]|uniref:nodulin homeobox isoform X1 n=1 Tax=Typha latifolia TaxID=4733 RepID=UPI003C2B4962
MKHGKEESAAGSDQNIDIVAAIQELNGLSSGDLSKLLKDSDNFTVQCKTDNGLSKQIDVEKLASFLPLHLTAITLSPDRDRRMSYVLCGIRLLHTLSDLATRHSRLEQVLLEDVKLSEQVMDLVFFLLIVLAHRKQDNHLGALPFLHSTLVACSLHLLTGYVSSQWHELVHVLLAHPKVDIFMDVAFESLHEDIRILSVKLSTLPNEVSCNESSLPAAVRSFHYICQQCEASLQFLLSLCQQKLFRDRVLRNKELCQNGGILSVARTMLRLSIPECMKESSDVVAAVSRLKAKVLSILLQLCEAESISYLDEVAGSPKSMQLGQSVALEFLNLLKTAFTREGKETGNSYKRSNPMGFLLINALRLVDIFSDDSNFRSSFMTTSVPFLTEILAIPHEEFVSSWCSVNLPLIEEDANLEYDPFTAAGVALIPTSDGCESAKSASVLLTEINYACPISFSNRPSITYAQLRTSYLVKIIANLHVFIPSICEEQERDLFLREFRKYLLAEKTESSRSSPSSNKDKAASVCENLSSLSEYGKSLTPSLLNEDDLQLLRVFKDTLQGELGEKLVQDMQKMEGMTPSLFRKQDGCAKEEISEVNEDVKGGFPEISLCQDLVQVNITRNPTVDPPSDFELDQAKGTNIISTTRNASGSLRGTEKGIANFETTGVELSSSKMDIDLIIPPSGEDFNPAEQTKESGFQEDEKAEAVQGEEKQPRKRKRNIMNERQINAIEKALLDEPEMQRNAALLQTWADKLSSQGSEITSSQLKNWLNNRKARLARAAKEARIPSEGDTPDKPSIIATSQFYDSPESASEENYVPSTRGTNLPGLTRCDRSATGEDTEMTPQTDFVHGIQLNRPVIKSTSVEPGRFVSLVDKEGKEVGKGKVFQVEGRWHGKNLADSRICIVDITELKTEKWKEVQHPSDSAGRTFEEAALKNGGAMRVAWDLIRVLSIMQ